jgi:hypothetical protein
MSSEVRTGPASSRSIRLPGVWDFATDPRRSVVISGFPVVVVVFAAM